MGAKQQPLRMLVDVTGVKGPIQMLHDLFVVFHVVGRRTINRVSLWERRAAGSISAAASRVIGGVVPGPHLPPHLLLCWWPLSLSPLFVPVHSVRRNDAHPGRCSSACRSMAACLLGGLRLQLPSLWCIRSAFLLSVPAQVLCFFPGLASSVRRCRSHLRMACVSGSLHRSSCSSLPLLAQLMFVMQGLLWIWARFRFISLSSRAPSICQIQSPSA
jgi:hypothetical protein